MIRAAALLAALLAAAPASASEPPQRRRAAEIIQVVRAATDALGMRPITLVEHVEPGLYRVRGGDCSVLVRIVTAPNRPPRPSALPLPAFEAVAGTPECG
ncbi:hypothetical protein [Roseococcus thiosulfatophilus]|uniref:hypothetical protein n=1 Tax=Roseococcus thiosulfatophilus TaxID=35813 RepID=UPI001A8FDB2F|nr:hypothetical protein [Roseococcus thiosulfatophilus]